MKFFSNLHRSIFDPSFSGEFIKFSAGRTVMFLLKLLVFTAVLSGGAKTYYLLHSNRGVTPIVSTMFEEMEIRDGRLETGRDVPFEMSKDLTGALLDNIVGFKVFERVPDNFFVVDTRNPLPDGDNVTAEAKILLKDTTVLFKDMRIEIPYEALVGKNFEFTVSAVKGFLHRNVFSFMFNFFVLHLFFTVITVVMSVFFLSAAAYLFSLDKSKKYGYFFRIACFSISPIMIGSALVAISGVNAEWSWYIFVILSTMLMFRAMAYVSNNALYPDDKKEV